MPCGVQSSRWESRCSGAPGQRPWGQGRLKRMRFALWMCCPRRAWFQPGRDVAADVPIPEAKVTGVIIMGGGRPSRRARVNGRGSGVPPLSGIRQRRTAASTPRKLWPDSGRVAHIARWKATGKRRMSFWITGDTPWPPRQWRVKYPPRWTQPEVPRLVPSSTAQRSMSAGAELRPTTDSSVFLLKVGQYGLVTIGIILLLTFAVLLCRSRPDHFMVGHAEAHFFKQGHRGGILVRRHQPKLVDALVSGPAAGVF